MAYYLRRLVRYAQRARRILLTQGPGSLVRVVERKLNMEPASVKREYPLLELSEPLRPLCFPVSPPPTVSVIVAMGVDFWMTHHCLAALLAQKCSHPFEVIVVGSRIQDAEERRKSLWKNLRVIVSPGENGIGDAYNRGAEVANGDYLVFLKDRAQVQAGWLDALIDTFRLKDDAGIVGSRLLYPDGRQWLAGGVVTRSGALHGCGQLDDPYRPEYSYLRAVDYCPGTCLAVRHSLFREIGGLDPELALSCYGCVDLAFRAKQNGFKTYFQPFAEAVAFGGKHSDIEQGGNGPNDRGSPLARELFVQRWKGVLQRHIPRISGLSRAEEHFESRRAFVSDFAVPAPDRDSGSLRMVNLFAILQEQGFDITFAPMGMEARQPYLADLQKHGVECLYKPYEDSIEEHLRRYGKRYDLVILSRLETASELMQTSRRWCPKAKILFDTVDLHFQRVIREGALRNDPRIKRIAQRVKKQELALVAKADTTLVVSEVEKALLAVEAPGADVRVVSNIHQINGSRKPFGNRRDILFVGGFGHPPNADAIAFFCEEVMPRILADVPDVRVFVIGSDPPPDVNRLAGDNVSVLGHVPNVEPYLSNCRLSVAPLRFGAGVKGKINQSLANGLPVVATSIAAEGMFLEDGESVLIADGAQEFADAVLRLYFDEALWNRLSERGLAVMEEHFSFTAARKALLELLSSLAVAPAD